MSKVSFARTKMDRSGSGRRGSLQLLDCSYSFTLRGKERLGTVKDGSLRIRVGVVAYNYSNVPVLLLCEAKKG